MNSFQQPIAGEISVGTYKYIENQDITTLYEDMTPTEESWYEIDFSPYVPHGTKMVRATVLLYSTNEEECYIYARRKGETKTLSNSAVVFGTQPANIVIVSLDLPVDSDGVGEIAYKNDSATTFRCYKPIGYYI